MKQLKLKRCRVGHSNWPTVLTRILKHMDTKEWILDRLEFDSLLTGVMGREESYL